MQLNCEVCGSKKECDTFGRKVFWARLGRCTNCKAMIHLGEEEHREKNKGKKAHVECPAAWRAAAPSIQIQVWPKAPLAC